MQAFYLLLATAGRQVFEVVVGRGEKESEDRIGMNECEFEAPAEIVSYYFHHCFEHITIERIHDFQISAQPSRPIEICYGYS